MREALATPLTGGGIYHTTKYEFAFRKYVCGREGTGVCV